MQTLFQLYLAAEQAAQALQDQLLETQDEVLLEKLESRREGVEAALVEARRNLLESDEPRLWVLEDEEGESPLARLELRPSELRERLRLEVIAANSDGLVRATVVKGYARCDATNEEVRIEVNVEPAEENAP